MWILFSFVAEWYRIWLRMITECIKRVRERGTGGDYMVRNFKISVPLQIFFSWSNEEEWDGQSTWYVWCRAEVLVGIWLGNLREGPLGRRRHKMTLKWIFKNGDGVGVWAGFIWHGIGAGGGLLWTQWWTFGFNRRRGISSLGEELLASQERLCYMELSYCYLHYTCNFVYLRMRSEFLRVWLRMAVCIPRLIEYFVSAFSWLAL